MTFFFFVSCLCVLHRLQTRVHDQGQITVLGRSESAEKLGHRSHAVQVSRPSAELKGSTGALRLNLLAKVLLRAAIDGSPSSTGVVYSLFGLVGKTYGEHRPAAVNLDSFYSVPRKNFQKRDQEDTANK